MLLNYLISSHDYYITGIKIVRIDDLIDLGCKLSKTRSPSPHIPIISSRSFKVSRFIMRLSKDFKSAKPLS